MAKRKHRHIRHVRHRRVRSAADFFGGRSTKSYEKSTYENKSDESKNDKSNENEQKKATPTREELLKELEILNLSANTVSIVLIATFLNYYYIQSLRAQTLDELNNTNLSENFIDTEDFPKLINTIFLYTTGVFLILNYTLLQETKSNHIDNLNDKEVLVAYRSFLSSVFTMLAVTASRNNLEF